MSTVSRTKSPPATDGGGRAYKPSGGGAESDDAVLLDIRSGKKERFEMLVVRHERPLYNFVLGHRLDVDAAADVTQEAFLKAYRALDGFDRKRSSFKTWLYTIAYNLVRDLGRRRQVRSRELKKIAQYKQVEAGAPGPEERTTLRDQVERLLAGVDDESRELLSMKFLHDLSYQGISEVTGLNQATIRSKVHRALKRLKTHVADEGGEETS